MGFWFQVQGLGLAGGRSLEDNFVSLRVFGDEVAV